MDDEDLLLTIEGSKSRVQLANSSTFQEVTFSSVYEDPTQPYKKWGIGIEAPCSKLQGIFDRKAICHFQIRSLTPQQAAGNALAFAVQVFCMHADNKSETQAHTKGFVNDTIPKPLGSTRNIDQ